MTQQRPARPGPSNTGPARPPARRLGPYGALLPLRVFAGGTFLYAGLDKLLTAGFLADSGPGSIGEQLDIFVRTSPLAPFVRAFALPAPTLIGLLMALAEIAIGLGVLSGLLYRTAAAAGAAVAALFWLTASWTTHPYYYGPDLPYLFGFVTLALAGHGGLYVLGPSLERWLRPADARTPAGVSVAAAARVANGSRPARDGRPGREGRPVPGRTPERAPVRAAERGPKPVVGRREILQAGLVGGTAVALAAGAGALGRVLGGSGTGRGVAAGTSPAPSSSAPSAAASTAPSAAASAAAPTPPVSTPAASAPASSAAAGGTVIANLSRFADGSAIDFTLPTTGDPGILVRLRDGTVVAYDAVCTHAGCPVGYDSGSGLLLCPCHGATFDPSNNAAVLSGPARTPLAAVTLVVDQKTGDISLAG